VISRPRPHPPGPTLGSVIFNVARLGGIPAASNRELVVPRTTRNECDGLVALRPSRKDDGSFLRFGSRRSRRGRQHRCFLRAEVEPPVRRGSRPFAPKGPELVEGHDLKQLIGRANDSKRVEVNAHHLSVDSFWPSPSDGSSTLSIRLKAGTERVSSAASSLERNAGREESESTSAR
jgi:hypothetical protein